MGYGICQNLGDVMKTHSVKASEIKREWRVVDASGRTLGRLASELAIILRGKHKRIYTPWLDTGDYVILVNASKLRVTGKKAAQKLYYHYSGYPGGLKSVTLAQLMQKDPCRVIRHAVKGMLPKGPLGRAMLRKLKVYPGPTHPHQAQVKD